MNYISRPIYCQACSDKYIMPRLSLYRPNKQNDYNFLDKTISEMLTVGGTDLYIHKYMGPSNQGPSIDYTQPEYLNTSPTNIQDLLFLENRDRTYDPNIYRLRGHYNVQNLDFDLSQFGLFLNNDILFITVHYNDMIDIIGRKLMVGDVLELPHLLDYNPLKETIPTALKRFYQITDANFASEGFTQTWYPHLWRIKCEKLVDSQEFSQILQEPINQDNYLGQWDKDKTYPPGYIISFGDKNYESITEVPAGVKPPDPAYWVLSDEQNLKDILSTYNKNIEINNAQLDEAKRLLPKAGYDRSGLYIVPTYGTLTEQGTLQKLYNQPAPPINTVILNNNNTGTLTTVSSQNYRTASPVLRLSRSTIDNLNNIASNFSINSLEKFATLNLELQELAPERIGNNSGPVSGTRVLTVSSMGLITGPYGTADNTYATADADPEAPGFTGDITQQMDWRADCDPRFQFIARASPRSFGYTTGYLDGTAEAPNGEPTGAGISFPQNPKIGDYFLRIDYFPQILYRWNGAVWVRISTNVRTETGMTIDDKSQLSSFINNQGEIYINNTQEVVPQRQALSTILSLKPDNLPPVA